MPSTHEDAAEAQVRAPDVLAVPFGVLVLLGIGTTLSSVVYLVAVTVELVSDGGAVQWQAFPFGVGMLAMGVLALLGALAFWRRQGSARLVALVVLPLFVVAGAVDAVVVDEIGNVRLNPYETLLLLLPVAAWAVLLLPSVRRYYEVLGRRRQRR